MSRRHLVAILLVALNLRPAIASVPPLTDAIAGALRLSATATGLLTALPVLCMGLFAPVGALAARRFGVDRVLSAAVALIAVGTALRVLRATPAVYGATIVVGVGIAVAGALLPALVRARFPDRVGPVTGAYTTALIGGALLAASLTEPLRSALGLDWSGALAVWSVPALLAFAVYVRVAGAPLASPNPVPPDDVPPDPVPPDDVPAGTGQRVWRDGTAWAATLFMGGQSLLFYAALAWLAPRYTQLGASAAEAGVLLGVFSAAQLVTAFAVPAFADRTGRTGSVVVACLTVSVVALVGIAVVPGVAPWLWVGLLGLAAGGQLALALTILGGLGRDAAETAAVSGMAFFVGYLLAATGPVLTGALRDATDGFEIPFLVLAAVAVATMVSGWYATRHRRTGGPSGRGNVRGGLSSGNTRA